MLVKEKVISSGKWWRARKAPTYRDRSGDERVSNIKLMRLLLSACVASR